LENFFSDVQDDLANSAPGSAAQSVQKWVVDEDVENQIRSGMLKRRLQEESLANGSIELYLRCSNFPSLGWGGRQPFSLCPSLLRISVEFGVHSSITNLGLAAFQQCSALKSITLPNNLKVIEKKTFNHCRSLKRVVCGKHLKNIGEEAFQFCSKLKDVQLASSSISFGRHPFFGCERLIWIAAAAGFPSQQSHSGDGVAEYLLARFERSVVERSER